MGKKPSHLMWPLWMLLSQYWYFLRAPFLLISIGSGLGAPFLLFSTFQSVFYPLIPTKWLLLRATSTSLLSNLKLSIWPPSVRLFVPPGVPYYPEATPSCPPLPEQPFLFTLSLLVFFQPDLGHLSTLRSLIEFCIPWLNSPSPSLA